MTCCDGRSSGGGDGCVTLMNDPPADGFYIKRTRSKNTPTQHPCAAGPPYTVRALVRRHSVSGPRSPTSQTSLRKRPPAFILPPARCRAPRMGVRTSQDGGSASRVAPWHDNYRTPHATRLAWTTNTFFRDGSKTQRTFCERCVDTYPCTVHLDNTFLLFFFFFVSFISSVDENRRVSYIVQLHPKSECNRCLS